MFLYARFISLLNSVLFCSLCAVSAPILQEAQAALPREETISPNISPEENLQEQVSRNILPEPQLSAEERSAILSKYSYVDPQKTVPARALENALVFWDKNRSVFKNGNYISVINYAQSSKEKRFYLINMQNGSVWAIHTAHGKGSDPERTGYATSFSNEPGSYATSLGYFVTGETYSGSHGFSLKLDGLSLTNFMARPRAIVIHGADYVQEADSLQGRSWGCPAVAPQVRTTVINALKDGSLLYAAFDREGREG